MKIVLIGDTLFDKEGVTIDKQVIEECQNSDLVICNLEGPITTALSDKEKGSSLATTPNNLHLLKKLNVKVAILGNNHIMDRGVEGLRETQELLAREGIRYVGAGYGIDGTPSMIELSNIVIFSYTHIEGPMYEKNGCGPVELPQIESMINIIEEYKNKNYKIIFNYHGGEEFFSVPWPRRRGFFRRISEAGADIIFGHHSHSIQPVEILDSKLIIYSPGNFYMDTPYQRKHSGTENGFITVINEERVRLQYIFVNRHNQKIYATKLEELSLLSNTSVSDNKLIGEWIKECKEIYNKPLKKESSYRFLKNSLIKRIIRYLFSVKKILKLKRKSRDLDVLLTSLPFLGRVYAKSLFKKGYRKFNF